jgi:hypothetical protein
MFSPEGKVLLIGELTTESISNELKINGKEYINKILRSSVENWISIASLLSDEAEDNISHVFMKLTEGMLFRCIDEDYFEALKLIFIEMREYPHQVFVYNDNLLKKFSLKDKVFIDGTYHDKSALQLQYNKDEFDDIFGEFILEDEKIQNLDKVIDYLLISGINIVPYSKRIDISISIKSLLENTIKGLLFKLYVNHEQLWSNEIDKLLSLFSDYLKKVKGLPVILDELNTQKGVIYSFYCDDKSLDTKKIQGSFNEFTGFLELCSKDIHKAASVLSETNLPTFEVDRVISRFTKEAKRLALDIKHEQESKMLSIMHRLESELSDIVPSDVVSETVVFQKPQSFQDITGTELFDGIFKNIQTLNINNPIIVSKVQGIVAQEINGNIHYNEMDKELLTLFKQPTISSENYLMLKTSLDELKDETAPETNRVTAWQKLKEFTVKAGSSIGQVGVNLLEKYIDKLLFGES